MPFVKGQSGNPKGRPKKDRALTAMLEAAGGRTVETGEGRRAQRRLAIENIWQGVTEGAIEFPAGGTLELGGREYVELVKWLFIHIDGPATQKHELSGPGGEAIPVRMITAEIPPDVPHGDDGDGDDAAAGTVDPPA